MKTNWTSLLISLAGGINTSLLALGVYHLTNDQLKGLDSAISIIVTLVGIVLSHKKPFLDAIKQVFSKKPVENK